MAFRKGVVEKIISRECTEEEEFSEGAAFLSGKASNKPNRAPAAKVRKVGEKLGDFA